MSAENNPHNCQVEHVEPLSKYERNIEYADSHDLELRETYGADAWIVVDNGGVVASSSDLDDLHIQLIEIPYDKHSSFFRKLDAPRSLEPNILST